jgi:acyl-CoA synthetase (AMP-forming)/AMP-acid ligase II
MACVALSPGMVASEKELLKLFVENLGRYKSPKRVIIRDTPLKGPSGKIQRLKLQLRYPGNRVNTLNNM